MWGSRFFVEQPWFPDGAQPVADLNLDMVGRNAGNQLLVSPFAAGSRGYGGLARRIAAIAPEEGFDHLASADGYYERSDQANFAKLGIPVAFLFSDVHPDYHEPTDDVEKIDGDKLRRVARLVVKTLVELQGDPIELTR
jgi:Zn-dependent M28 family amino/carboxypeptidase